MTCTDVGGRVTNGAGSSVAAEWPDRARPVTLQPLPRYRAGAVACTNLLGGFGHCEWPSVRVSREQREEAKGRARRHWDIAFVHRARNNPCDQCGQDGLSFLALAGPAVRRLGDSAPRWPAGSPAQWQTGPRTGAAGAPAGVFSSPPRRARLNLARNPLSAGGVWGLRVWVCGRTLENRPWSPPLLPAVHSPLPSSQQTQCGFKKIHV